MATSEVEVERSGVKLKHLEFVRSLAINAAVIVSNLYCYAKENSGTLKSSVGKVEDAAAAYVGPVFEKFKGVTGDILVLLDNKVDEAAIKFEECAPPAAKSAALKAQSIANKATHLAKEFVDDARKDGLLAAVSHAANISKDAAINGVAVAWYKASHYPALQGVLEIAVPTAMHWSEKYNSVVKDLAAKGYSVFSYVPLVPVEEMEKAYKQAEAADSKKTDSENSTGSSSQSDSDKE